ncbi:integral membrane zinc-metalloprotease [Sulfurimicrobium lacus]|uniref:Integral membrane zinc-metalloprotease n=1 Tax=Sulfurimicrobium lacus TaxID=2715678 RepID=A0A6F8VE29_9PROT|nr:M48 family metallopeptidase [Sulfurimicrobium lacus]BCB26989.1 integral membrane zinc-metalloprotease [Sulfurimicrobium lacus]
MPVFTLIFIAALLLTTATRLWLAQRHLRHVRSHRDTVPPDFAEHIGLESHQKAADYSCAKTRLGVAHIIVDAALLLVFTLGGGIQALADFWQGLLGAGLWRGVALIASVLVISSLLELPLSLYRTFVIDARFNFNKMTIGLFLADLLKQTLIGAALGIPLLLGMLWLMEQMGTHWWLYVWFAWMSFNLLILLLYPTVIAPIFNKFTPLQDQALATRIETLLQKCGFKSQGLFVMDGSRRTSHGNAYFSGLGASKRIVFFDTLLSRLNHDEIEAVLAHELGHFKRRHVVKRIAAMFVLSLAGLWLLGWLMPQPWFYQGLGVATRSTDTALLLFLLISPVFTFLFHPLSSLLSRKHEFEADRYAAENASAKQLIHALVKLYNDNAATLTPDPLHSLFYDSHPAAGQRVAHLRALMTHI